MAARYRASMRLAYAVAYLALWELARNGGDFEFGPASLDALEDQGLVVSGPDCEGAQAVLAGIEGLYLSDD